MPYLDNAATSFPKPECVYTAVDAFMRHNGSAFARGAHVAGQAGQQMVTQCRHRVAEMLDAESTDRIAFTFNCTDSLNLLLRGVLNAGDRVVTTTLEHNSVLRPLHQLKQESGVDVVHVEFDADTGLVDAKTMAEEISSAPTRLVVLNHASNVTGTIQPVAEISKQAHAAGALLLLDAAQTAGHLPFSVQQLGVDMLASAGHKGLLGPLGTGLIYIRRNLENEIRSIRSGGTGTASESLQQPSEMPARFESGNLNMPGLAGLNAATEWLVDYGVENAFQHTTRLTQQLGEQLSAIASVTLYSNFMAPNIGVINFTIDGYDSRDVGLILDDSFQIQCRTGIHCAPLVHQQLRTQLSGGTVRLSPGVFTTEADILRAVAAIQAIAA